MIGKIINFAASKKTSRKIDSIQARIDNLFKGCLKENIFYLHINKCGGSSINRAIKACYFSWNIFEDRNLAHLNAIPSFIAAKINAGEADFSPDAEVDDDVLRFRESILLYYMSHGNIKYISGHFSFSEIAYRYFSEKYAFITVLREPISRWISSYFYNRFNRMEHCKIQMDIQDYLESELGQSHGCEYTRILGNLHEKEDCTSKEAIEKTKQNLHKFSLVGCLEYQDVLIQQFTQQFGRKLIIRKVNQNPKSKAYQKSIITPEIKEKITEICKPDLEIYQYAVENFIKK